MTYPPSSQLNDFIVCCGRLICANKTISEANRRRAQCCHAARLSGSGRYIASASHVRGWQPLQVKPFEACMCCFTMGPLVRHAGLPDDAL